MSKQNHAKEIYTQYRERNGFISPPYGHCQIIAALICLDIPEAEPVGGYCSNDEDSGSHWYSVLPNGEVLDPLGADWIDGGVKHREEKVRGVCYLVASMHRSWSENQEVLELAKFLMKCRDEVSALRFAEMFPDGNNLAPHDVLEHKLRIRLP